MKKKYTHLFFDLDNTLWDFKKNSQIAMLATFKHFKIGVLKIRFEDFFEVYLKHNHALWESYRKKEVGKKELIRRRFEATFLELGIEGIDTNRMNASYLNEMPKQKTLYPGVIETLEYLKMKRYQMFIITNGFKEVQHKKLESSGLNPFFEKVFTSEEIKTPKPGREIFEYAVTSVNAKKSNSLMIGDDWEVDVIGATNFGIDAVYIGNKENSKSKNEYLTSLNKSIIFCFTNIGQIKSIL